MFIGRRFCYALDLQLEYLFEKVMLPSLCSLASSSALETMAVGSRRTDTFLKRVLGSWVTLDKADNGMQVKIPHGGSILSKNEARINNSGRKMIKNGREVNKISWMHVALKEDQLEEKSGLWSFSP